LATPLFASKINNLIRRNRSKEQLIIIQQKKNAEPSAKPCFWVSIWGI